MTDTDREIQDLDLAIIMKQFGCNNWKSYLVYDIETTGLDFLNDVITQFGYLRIVDGKIAKEDQIIIDWTKSKLDQDWLKERLDKANEQLVARSGYPSLSYEELKTGITPEKARDLIASILAGSHTFSQFKVGHNIHTFDNKFICSFMRDTKYVSGQIYAHSRVANGLNSYYNDSVDTGVIEKACQIHEFPKSGESILAFSNRIKARKAKGVNWSLSGHCVSKYELDKKHGLDVSKAHTALYDSRVTHLLFEEYKSITSRCISE